MSVVFVMVVVLQMVHVIVLVMFLMNAVYAVVKVLQMAHVIVLVM